MATRRLSRSLLICIALVALASTSRRSAADASVVHGYFLRLINSLLCRLPPRRFENPRFLDVVFRKHNDPKILLNVNLLTSHGFCSRIAWCEIFHSWTSNVQVTLHSLTLSDRKPG
jgi:hypothetical protein